MWCQANEPKTNETISDLLAEQHEQQLKAMDSWMQRQEDTITRLFAFHLNPEVFKNLIGEPPPREVIREIVVAANDDGGTGAPPQFQAAQESTVTALEEVAVKIEADKVKPSTVAVSRWEDRPKRGSMLEQFMNGLPNARPVPTSVGKSIREPRDPEDTRATADPHDSDSQRALPRSQTVALPQRHKSLGDAFSPVMPGASSGRQVAIVPCNYNKQRSFKTMVKDFAEADADQREKADRAHHKNIHKNNLRQTLNDEQSEDVSETYLQTIVRSSRFEVLFAIAIVTNSVFVGVQVNYGAENRTNYTPPSFYVLQTLYAGIFFVELMFRLLAEGRRLFTSPGWAWAYLDVFIVMTSLFEVVMDALYVSAIKGDTDEKGVSRTSNVRIVRILRIARLLRIIRIARILRFFHALRTFVFSIIATMQSLVWALVLLLLIIYVFGILLGQTAGDFLIDQASPDSTEDPASEEIIEKLNYFWGTLPRSMFTLYKTISNGLDWDTCVYPLHVLGWSWVLIFSIYISFTCFAVLNVVTGIFCQSAIETAQRNEDLMVQQQISNKEFYIARLEQLFTQMDVDCSGTITIGEFEECFNEPNVQAVFDALEISAADAWTLFKILANDQTHELQLNDFVGGLMRLRGNAKRADFIEMQTMQKRMLKLLQDLTKVVVEIGSESKGHAGLKATLTQGSQAVEKDAAMNSVHQCS